MGMIRGLLFDNLGLKLVALLLAVLVYLNVYTDRPATMIVSFPIQIAELADTLSLSGPAPAAVQAELRGTGKQLIRLRVTEPPVKISLAGVGAGRFERALSPGDLPLPQGIALEVERMVSPRTVELTVDRKVRKWLPVAPRVEGQPASSVVWAGMVRADPASAWVTGPERELALQDSVVLAPVAIGGRRDTVRAAVGARALPDWCTMEPERVTVTVPLEPGALRHITMAVESPTGVSEYSVTPAEVAVTVSAPRSLMTGPTLDRLSVRWRARTPLSEFVGRRVAVELAAEPPPGVHVRIEPDSVTLRRAGR